ncbi:hypothetical protein OV079_04005 [Nannocystis pusilla]|uniref:Uncharacterized protein n=1 Tax=Nannocystis pusilla TaxID=889268 RepID=A0A9X3EII6_9BACT|nr:hypothetical protein [Nannocystis pusilla]MCY1004748.1 hypothetical protein [Nannocystis pusilla]
MGVAQQAEDRAGPEITAGALAVARPRLLADRQQQAGATGDPRPIVVRIGGEGVRNGSWIGAWRARVNRSSTAPALAGLSADGGALPRLRSYAAWRKAGSPSTSALDCSDRCQATCPSRLVSRRSGAGGAAPSASSGPRRATRPRAWCRPQTTRTAASGRFWRSARAATEPAMKSSRGSSAAARGLHEAAARAARSQAAAPTDSALATSGK